MDEIAYNAINTDASPQIDILLGNFPLQIEPSDSKHKDDNPMLDDEANTENNVREKPPLISTIKELEFNDIDNI